MPDISPSLEAVSHSVIGAFFDVYTALGYGFLEHVYAAAMERELLERGHRVAREYGARVYYNGHLLTTQRLDVVVDESLVIEIKATQELHPAAKRQLYNYLRATDLEVGLLLHFGPRPRVYREISTSKPHSARRPPKP